MKAWFLILALAVTTQDAFAQFDSPWPGSGEDLASRPWIHAMEASLQPISPQTPPIPLSTWLGWGLAFVFFVYLLNLHLKMKRRQQFLLRGGERDFFILPPSRNRRKGPR